VHARGDTVGGAIASVWYDYAIQDPCSSASLSASPASPQRRGATITFTASSTGCLSPQYLFWLWDGVSWRVMQDYSSSAQYVWVTKGLAAQLYSWVVYARGDTVGGAIASAWYDYTLKK